MKAIRNKKGGRKRVRPYVIAAALGILVVTCQRESSLAIRRNNGSGANTCVALGSRLVKMDVSMGIFDSIGMALTGSPPPYDAI